MDRYANEPTKFTSTTIVSKAVTVTTVKRIIFDSRGFKLPHDAICGGSYPVFTLSHYKVEHFLSIVEI